MMLYIPTEAEIVAVIGAAIARAPRLRDRLMKAADLLRLFVLAYSSGDFTCASQSRPGEVHHVRFGACDCEDAGRDGADGHAYCKHRLALLAYREILLAHLRERLLGDAADPAVCAQAHRAANAGIMRTNIGGDVLLAYYPHPRCIPKHLICLATDTPRGLTLPTEFDLACFASFLAKADSLPVDLEALAVYERLTAQGASAEAAAEAADAVLGVVHPLPASLVAA